MLFHIKKKKMNANDSQLSSSHEFTVDAYVVWLG